MESVKLELTEKQYQSFLENPWIEINGVEYCKRSRVEELMQKVVDSVTSWIKVTPETMPKEGQVIDVWKMWNDGSWGRQTNVIFKNEHIIEYSYWMPSPLPPNDHERK